MLTVNLVTSPKITALLGLSMYVTIDGEVIKTEWLNECQLRAQAVRWFENYSYSVIANKLGPSKAWVHIIQCIVELPIWLCLLVLITTVLQIITINIETAILNAETYWWTLIKNMACVWLTGGKASCESVGFGLWEAADNWWLFTTLDCRQC